MNAIWLIIGIIIGLLFLIAIIPEIYSQTVRKKDKKARHRAKRRIRL